MRVPQAAVAVNSSPPYSFRNPARWHYVHKMDTVELVVKHTEPRCNSHLSRRDSMPLKDLGKKKPTKKKPLRMTLISPDATGEEIEQMLAALNGTTADVEPAPVKSKRKSPAKKMKKSTKRG